MPRPPETLSIRGHGIAGALLAETASAAGFRVKVHDTGLPSASRVAAGLFTPVTGQRLSLSWNAEAALPLCHDVYPALERMLGVSFYTRLPTLRMFSSAAQRREWEGKPRAACVREIARPNLPLNAAFGCVEIDGGGWVNLPVLLDALKARRMARDEWGECPEADLQIDCTGHHASTHPLWKEADWRNAHGEVLTVEIPGLPQNRIYSFEKFLMPLGEERFRLGATYAWDRTDPAPTPQGRAELGNALRGITDLPFIVIDHQAGIRPVAHARVPIAGPHPDQPREWILNGYGSKGVLYAPWICQCILNHWQTGTPLPKEIQAPRRILRQRDRKRTQLHPARGKTALP
jgi:glycine oxidase